MPDRVVDRVHDGLPIGADFVHVVVEVENPPQRVLRGRYVVALRAKHDDRGTNIPQINRSTVRDPNIPSRQIIPNEQLIDDELNLLGVEIAMAAPQESA